MIYGSDKKKDFSLKKAVYDRKIIYFIGKEGGIKHAIR